MKATVLLSGVIGVLIGAVLMAALVFVSASGMMIVESPSTLAYQATVDTIVGTAEGMGWSVPTVHHIDVSVGKKGYDVLPTAVIELCNPDLAGKILADEDARVVASMMPCRIAVYQRKDGGVTVSRMNTGLVSKLFGGFVAEMMAQATGDSEAIIASVS